MIAAEQYTRRFWPLFVAIPVCGLLALFFGNSRGLQAFGMLCIAWPLSIPARSVFITSKLARKFANPTTVTLEDKTLYFTQGESGMKLPLEQLRKVEKRKGFYILETKMLNMVPIPEAAISSNRKKFEKALGV